MKPLLADAYKLFHDGSQALATVEGNGIKIDTEYLSNLDRQVTERIRDNTSTLRKTEVWKVWRKRFGDKAKLGSRTQFAEVFFKDLGYTCREFTDKGGPSTEETNFAGILGDHGEFVQKYFRTQKYHKLSTTYIRNIQQEIVDDFLHPNFHLHTVRSYRSSGSDPNFQNFPARDHEIMNMIRRAFIPRSPKRRIAEVDLSGAEVRVSYCYHLDPTMYSYLMDPNSDMHGDTAEELFVLPKGFVKQNAAWAKKSVRDWAKNRFVFPQFYGSVFFQCAPHLWEVVAAKDDKGEPKYRMPDGKPVIEHLREQGIHGLGTCNPKVRPAPGTFEYRCRQVETAFWEQRFPVYTEWKSRWYKNYQANGYFDLHTGFRCAGLYKRNQVICIPVQGAAFHVLLWSLIRVQKWLEKYNMKSRIIGQIHDSLIADVVEDELQDYITVVRHAITEACPKHWKWITIPLEVEAEVCGQGESWEQKKVWVTDPAGVWIPKPAPKK